MHWCHANRTWLISGAKLRTMLGQRSPKPQEPCLRATSSSINQHQPESPFTVLDKYSIFGTAWCTASLSFDKRLNLVKHGYHQFCNLLVVAGQHAATAHIV